MSFEKAVGKAVRDVREKKNLTQEAFSHVSSRTHVSRLEQGNRGATLALINRLAGTMEVHPLTILTLAYLNANEDVDVMGLHGVVLKELSDLHLIKGHNL